MKFTQLYFLFCIALSAPLALAQSKYSYLHQTTNEILQIDRSSMKMTPGDFASIATRACKTLELLLKDENFKKDLSDLANAAGSHSTYHKQLTDDLVLFIDSFLRRESDLLKQAGLTPKASSEVLLVASSVRVSLREKPDLSKLIENIERLRTEICRAASAVAKAQDDERAREQRWKTVRRWGLGLAGLSLIGADAIALAPSGGVATASFTLGGVAVGAAIAQ
ncbi:MAG: hypothetical protein BroJett031_31590 [Betaproteobacteria bacterium]|nr:MAG: hypothetical protein BroJett031_31590 [Betaproteobacteria bacterium]